MKVDGDKTITLSAEYIWIYARILDNSNGQIDVHQVAKLHKYGGCRTCTIIIRSCGCCVVALVVII